MQVSQCRACIHGCIIALTFICFSLIYTKFSNSSKFEKRFGGFSKVVFHENNHVATTNAVKENTPVDVSFPVNVITEQTSDHSGLFTYEWDYSPENRDKLFDINAPWAIVYTHETDEMDVAKYVTNSWTFRSKDSKGSERHEYLKLLWRKIIYENQNPSSCNQRRCRCVVTQGGYFSKIHGMLHCLFKAIAENCTLVSTNNMHLDNYASTDNCKGGWCHFQPYANCPDRGEIDMVIPISQKCRDWSMDMLSVKGRFPVLNDMLSSIVFRSELMSYIMRPAKNTVQNLQIFAHLLGVPKYDDHASTFGVHVRFRDKRSFKAIEDKSLVTNYGPSLLALSRATGLSRVHYMSDSIEYGNKANQLLTANQSNLEELVTIPMTVFPSFDLVVNDSSTATAILLSRLRGQKHELDEGLLLFIQVMLLGFSKFFMGFQNSNIAQAATEIHALFQYPPNFQDLFHQPYQGCWMGEAIKNWIPKRTKLIRADMFSSYEGVANIERSKIFWKTFESTKVDEH